MKGVGTQRQKGIKGIVAVGERMPIRTKNLASEEKSPGYATPKSRLVPGKQQKTT
jgi:hypothetical protein